MKSKKIYIGGNIYGAGNIGDDAVLQGIIYLLRETEPNASITVGTHEGTKLKFLPPNIHYINSYKNAEIIATIKDSDCVISGGGTMIGDELGLVFPLEYNAKLIPFAKMLGKKTLMLAIGANRLKTEKGKKYAKAILQSADLVTLRDENSKHVCLELGSNLNSIFTTADPAFLLDKSEMPRTKQIKSDLNLKGKVFGVNVVNEAWTENESYKKCIASACDFFAERYNYIPVFFCNEIRDSKNYDYEANKQTASYLKCKHVLLKPVYYSPQEMIDIISTFNFLIGMRMHALIFAAIASVPFVSVSRVDKVDNFMNLFGLKSSGSIENCSSDTLIKDIEHLLSKQDRLKIDLLQKVAGLRNACLKNVEMIRHLLHRNSVRQYKNMIFALYLFWIRQKLHDRFRKFINAPIN